MSIFRKAWRVLKSARHALGVFADVGTAFRAIVRGDLGKVIDKVAEVDGAIDRAEDAVKRGGSP